MTRKASIKAKYEPYNDSSTATLAWSAGDLKLRASCTDKTFQKLSSSSTSSANGLSFGLEKPGFFIFNYDVPKKAARFQFMSSAKVLGKQVKLTYIHPQKVNATVVEGTLVCNPENKVTAKYSFLSGYGSLKYSYVHSYSNVTFEPMYDFASKSWNFTVSQKVAGDNTVKASYEASKKALALEWTRESKETGSFKICATVNTEQNKPPPNLWFEKTWDFEF